MTDGTCPRCGTAVAGGTRFCPACGLDLAAAAGQWYQGRPKRPTPAWVFLLGFVAISVMFAVLLLAMRH